MKYIIYKILIIEKPEFIYVGSTKNFTRRKNEHKSRSNFNQNNELLYKTINENGGWANCEMNPVEKITVESCIDARIREEYWRRELNANLNSKQCFTTEQEHKDTHNKNKMISYYRHQEMNIGKSKQYREAHPEKMKQLKKEWYELNKEAVSQRVKEVVLCQCGHSYTRSNKARHEKSKKHSVGNNNQIQE
jgi:hypothetical protein